MTLTELSIKRPTLIVVIFAVLGVLGLFSYGQLKYELLPKISSPVVTIATVYPGASPNEVETSVTKVIEDAVSGIDKVQAVRSTSREGVSFIMVEFLQSANIDVALQDAQRKVGEVVALLPDQAKSPTLSKFALDEIPVLRMGVTANMPEREFYQFLKDRIKPQLSKVPGVGQVTLVGGTEREIRVNVDADKLNSYGLSILSVSQAINAANLDFPTGNIKDADGQFVVRIAGKVSSIEELRNLVIGKSKVGGDIKLSDVAEVQDGEKEALTMSRINNVSSVGILVQKQSDANSVDVSKLVRAELTKIESANTSTNLRFDLAQDGSVFTVDAADAVKHDLFLAIILVAAVMLLFLHSVRNSVIVMIAIPASLISTFIAMFAFGLTLNLMTLLALSLVVGILVDDSIVVLENIYRRLEMGDDQRTAALRGRNEIGFAALSITLVDVVVFLPLTLVQGLIGNILRDFSLVVVVSTMLSLFVSFTVTPALASRFSKLQHLTKRTLMGRFGLWFERQYEKLKMAYSDILGWSLNHRWVIFTATIAMFIGSLMLVAKGFIGGEFITQSDRGEFTVSLELPAGAKLEQTNQVTQQVEAVVLGMPEVRKAFVNVGTSSEGLIGQTSNNSAELNISLTPKEERVLSTDEVAQAIKDKVSNIPGVKVRVNPIGIFGTANQTPIQIGMIGQNLDSVREAANLVASMMLKIPGTADVRLSSEDGKPETRVEIDREKMASFGLSLAEVGGALRTALTGDDDAKFRDGNTEYDIRIMLDQHDRSRTTDIGELTFPNRSGEGGQVQLKQFASVVQTTGPTLLQRKDRNTTINVLSQVVGRPSGSVGGDIRKGIDSLIANHRMPAGIDVAYDGDLKNQGDAFGSLGAALMAAILFVYMVMVALYNSYRYPFVVLFSIPVAIIGALLALALTAKSLNIFSILGMIMLIGLVTKNAILIVDFTNRLREEGKSRDEALMEAGRERLRPIIMTTLTMIFGMFPIALSTSAGAEWKSGLAWVLIGGLTSSLLLTLVLVPVVYKTLDGTIDWIGALVRKVTRRRQPKVEIIPEPVAAKLDLGPQGMELGTQES
jgi:HAE1 family hydrophobic/amphiphilic exporter-1